MKKLLAIFFLTTILANSANAKCSYFQQRRMIKNEKMVKNKVINAQVKGKMLAIQKLAGKDYCNTQETKQKILLYQQQIIDLTNQKICIKNEYKASLKKLKIRD